MKGEIVHLSFDNKSHQKAIAWLKKHYPNCTLATDSYSEKICQQFTKYFKGQSDALPPLNSWPFFEQGTDFQRQVWELIATIPRGETFTYGYLAKKIGKPKAARAVGQACHTNPIALIVPCHRVVGSNGIGGFAGGSEVKKRLLEMEKLER